MRRGSHVVDVCVNTLRWDLTTRKAPQTSLIVLVVLVLLVVLGYFVAGVVETNVVKATTFDR